MPETKTSTAVQPALSRVPRPRTSGRVADALFGAGAVVCALAVFVIVAMIVGALVSYSRPSLHAFGWQFFLQQAWDPVHARFGAVVFLFGTAITSLLALLLAGPPAIAAAVFSLEICPKPLRGPIAFLTELLAAVPSVVYGLWALLVLAPLMHSTIGPWLVRWFGWTGLFRGPNFGVSVLTAGIILAVMIFPLISAVSRDLMRAVPVEQREAMLALGATRWEMVRTGVLRNARAGLAGALILGLGRALGETMAVTMVIGNHPAIARSLFSPGYTMASVIANEFSEATADLHLSALMEIGLALFVVTTIANAVARLLVWMVVRQSATRPVS